MAHKWTWYSRDGKRAKLIDYVIVNRRLAGSTQDTRVYESAVIDVKNENVSKMNELLEVSRVQDARIGLKITVKKTKSLRLGRSEDEKVTFGIAFTVEGSAFYTIGDDKTIRRWKCETPLEGNIEEVVSTNISKSILLSISHHWRDAKYATAGEVCQIWEESRAQPIRSFLWGVDSLHQLRFNYIETNILSARASDRSVILYDIREKKPLRKVVMKLQCNALSWNPMEAFTFTVANEDYHLYSFDMRNLNAPMNVHKDRTSAVIDVDYSPTVNEFVSGSYDKTITIFEADKGHSRDIYHTKRMQRITCVLWSNDDKYIMSGSDEMNIRMWKARASEKLGIVKERERVALNSAAKLKEKFAAHPQIKRIARHRQVPRHVFNAKKELKAMVQSRARKEANRRAHSKPGTVPYVPERQKHVVREDE
ncbi:DDB1- and CUL4-associated factor 13-like [Artemia franciscana]|uniref:DDB1- and CUL4-associated factor 13-like n=1 Tax=Artemia franciscana TaxID=6661 RepID=UPI0032DBB209